MGYFYLIIAIIGEVIGTTYLKSTNNFSEFLPSTYVVLGYTTAFYFMMLAMKTIPVAITYSIWAAVGISAITILSALKYKEIPDLLAILGLGLIIVGVIILVFFSGELVWRDRDVQINEVIDSTPHSSLAPLFSKTISLLSLSVLIHFTLALIAIIYQLLMGYNEIEFSLYIKDFLYNLQTSSPKNLYIAYGESDGS